jgi:hypothetical protein
VSSDASRLIVRHGRKVILVPIFLAAFGTYLLRAANDGKLGAPPENGDGHDYDAIAFNIWQHGAYGYHWDDPSWREPYTNLPEYEGLLERRSSYYPTTYRPPAMPLLLGLVYQLTGRNFVAWRIVNCAIVAGAVTLAAAIAAYFSGSLAAIVAAILIVQSPQLTFYSHMFVTEGLAAFFVTLLAWTWLRNARRGWTTAGAAAFGVVLGALVATRSIFVFWLPLALFVPSEMGVARIRAWRLKAICLAFAILVIGPWWIRNIAVTRAFFPLGTEGAINLPAAFGPRALRFEGLWAANQSDGAPELSALNLDPVRFEVRLARYRTRMTTAWMREHPFDVLRLAALHVWQEIRPRGDPYDGWRLLIGAGLGAAFFRRSAGILIMVLILCAHLLSIAVTWSVGGRFMVPVQPVCLALTAALAISVTRQIVRRFDALDGEVVTKES